MATSAHARPARLVVGVEAVAPAALALISEVCAVVLLTAALTSSAVLGARSNG